MGLLRFDLPQDPYDTVADGVRSTLRKATDLAPAVGRVLGIDQPQGGVRYRAFLSYSHRDEKVARWLHRAIENFAVPKELVGTATARGAVPARLRPVFRDEDELPGAAELGPVLLDALRGSAALIVLCSPACARSVWCDREIRFFKQHNPDRPVLAVITEGVPGGDEECFPAALKLALGDAGELVADDSVEPLAPDLQKQDRHVVKLKLIAGLLGVTYNDLYRRDRRRARKLRVAFGTLALVVIAALTALSISAVSSAREARRERNAALAAQARAEHNAELAERRAWLAQQSATTLREMMAMQAPAQEKK